MDKNERIDNIGFNNLRLIQKPEDFCYGIDAVILSHFAATRGELNSSKRIKDEIAYDLGTGTGVIPLILSHKTDINKIYGVEIQEESYIRAVKNVKLNNMEERIEILNGDIIDINKIVPTIHLGCVDLVTANPPYMSFKGAIKNANIARTIARHEEEGTLENFIKAAWLLLKDKGNFYMVHRPERLVDIFEYTRKYRLEPKGIQFVSPRIGDKPNIVLIHFVKNGNKTLKFMDPLNVYDGKDYSEEINSIYEKK